MYNESMNSTIVVSQFSRYYFFFFFFFFNDTATTEIYTLSLHDALPISTGSRARSASRSCSRCAPSMRPGGLAPGGDRKSTRLNSSHSQISYAVFCLKKKKTIYNIYLLNNHEHMRSSKTRYASDVRQSRT